MLPQRRFSIFLKLLYVVDQASVTIYFLFFFFLRLPQQFLLFENFFIDHLVYFRDVAWSLLPEFDAFAEL